MKKYALVTGATSGIGLQVAKKLSDKGFKVIACGRNKSVLSQLSKKHAMLPCVCDLSDKNECVLLWKKFKDLNICAVVNCAGFGFVSDFDEITVEDDVKMINVNVTATQILTKLFATTMQSGVILNVCSSAAFSPEPLMASYAASKAYVYSYSRAVDYELKKRRSRVRVCLLCPGAVSTPFEAKAGVKDPLPGMSAEKCALYAVKTILKQKPVCVPGLIMKASHALSKIVPETAVLYVQYKIQGSKK